MSQIPGKQGAAADAGSTPAAARPPGRDVVTREGGTVSCPTHAQEALVSAIERAGPHGKIRYIQWCSLIDLDDCGQECMGQLATADEGKSLPSPAEPEL